jgi:hypothetical protein
MLNGGDNLEYSTRGWHRLFWDEGIQVDFIEASYFDEIEIDLCRFHPPSGIDDISTMSADR